MNAIFYAPFLQNISTRKVDKRAHNCNKNIKGRLIYKLAQFKQVGFEGQIR